MGIKTSRADENEPQKTTPQIRNHLRNRTRVPRFGGRTKTIRAAAQRNQSSVLDTTALLGIEALMRSHTVEFHKTHFQRIQNHNDAKRVERHMLSFPGSLVCIQIVWKQ